MFSEHHEKKIVLFFPMWGEVENKVIVKYMWGWILLQNAMIKKKK